MREFEPLPAIVQPAQEGGTIEVDQLVALATKINQAHDAVQVAGKRTIQHAMEAGDLLIQAKTACRHGKWSDWLEANFKASARTAQAYMQLARNREKLNPQSSAVLSIQEALDSLGDEESEFEDKKPRPLNDFTVAERQKFFGRWWDQLAAHVVLRDAAGWTPSQIAKWAGVRIEEVKAILTPRRPVRSDQEFARIYPDPAKRAIVLQAYNDAVQMQVHNSLETVFSMAQHYAKQEGFDYLLPELEKRQQMHADAHAGRDQYVYSSDRQTAGTLVLCTWDDMRSALGIEESTFDSWTEMFVRNWDLWAENDNAVTLLANLGENDRSQPVPKASPLQNVHRTEVRNYEGEQV